MLGNKYILVWANVTNGLHAKVADIQKLGASAKSTITKGRCKKQPTVADKHFIALEAEVKKANDAQK